MMNGKYLAAMIFCVVAITAIGCGSAGDGRERFPVSGNVTFEGNPLVEGKLVLLPAKGEVGAGPTEVVLIENGAFSGVSTPGRKRVEFYASWPNGKMITLENGSQVEDTATLPPSCNVHSQHELEVQRGPNDGLVWDLK